MNCEQAQNLLSAFHDRELNSADRAAVEGHLATCTSCAAELAAIAELGEMARMLCEPEPPAGLWQQLAHRLAIGTPTRFARTRRVLRTWKMTAVAALVLLGVGTGWFAHEAFDPAPLAVSPAAGGTTEGDLLLDDLLAASAGERVSLQEAAGRVGFRVLAASDLPEGYRLGECCVCRDGCCDLVQYRFLRGAEQMILVQCSPDHSVRYGKRPVLETRVNGKAAQVVQCDGCLACCWQSQGTALTLVGPRDLSQLVQLVAYVDQRLEAKP